ncbi:MAG: MogA/MoaB family molybdenum cofactor biosynthesis protein [Candidatus Methanosuratincola sp.]|jgi:molybdenum cofactor biosynthesis protein B|nr:molybdenum cofactor biosynthesis protein B [Candidatus Methanosuratincola sp.]
MHAADHHEGLPKSLRFMVIVTSDTIVAAKEKGQSYQDISGDVALSLILSHGFKVSKRIYLPNKIEAILKETKSGTISGSNDVIVIIGGTGLSRRDVSIEAVAPMFEKQIPGFGEIFRQLSYGSIGTSAIASRATAGVVNGTIVFVLPGSPEAVKMAMERIILPEAPHLIKMIRG